MEISKKFCENCKHDISVSNFELHIVHCKRNIKLCDLCNEPITASRFKTHLDEDHAMEPCSKCEITLEKWMLPKHQESCPRRLVSCEFCEAEIFFNEYGEHKDFCGSRTEKCRICQKYIMLKDKETHFQEKNCGNQLVKCSECGNVLKRKNFVHHAKFSCARTSNKGGSSNILKPSTQTEKLKPLPTQDKSTNTDEDSVKLLETLSDDFSTFYESNIDNDCILKVNKTQFLAHRAVLSARSTVFSAMFHHDTMENRCGEVDIPDVDATTLSDVLYYIYSGKVRGLTADSAVSMYNVTDKYALLKLRKKCMDFLKLNLTMDNICDAAVLAHTHGETELEERVVLFIEDRLEELVQSEKWNELLGIKPIFASKLLSKAFVASKKRHFQGKSEK